jgi:NAD(P) transhydrogenase subunit alpha
MTLLFVAKESLPGETRVAASPETVARMTKNGLHVQVAAGAGNGSSYSDAAFEEAGATVIADNATGFGSADMILKVGVPTPEEAAAMRKGSLLVGFLQGTRFPETARALAEAGVDCFAMELVPRITRAQKMDALSSQANIAGYKAVLLGAAALPRFFPLMMTAAGTVKPARVVIFGVGVAGLQAIATAKRLGAQVEATDIRPEVKEQVLSLGGKFIEVAPDEGGEEPSVYAKEASEDYKRRQAEAVGASVAQADVVITTAQVPGARAPMLVPAAMVETMKPGAVIVDLAIDQGGNCELSELGKDVVHHGVTILGASNLPATVANDASQLYARNVLQVVEHLAPVDKESDAPPSIVVDLEDEISAGSIAIRDGKILHQPTADAAQAGAAS